MENDIESIIWDVSEKCLHAAADSLMMITDTKISFEVRSVKKLSLEMVINEMEDDRVHFGSFMGIDGQVESNVLVMIPDETASSIASSMMGNDIGASNLYDEMTISCLEEVGNIITSSFCSAMSDHLDLDLMPTPPDITFDDPRTLLGFAVVQFGGDTDNTIITSCRLLFDQEELDMKIYLIPPRMKV